MMRKKGGAGMHVKNEPENHPMLVHIMWVCKQLCVCFTVQRFDSEQDASSVSYFNPSIESALAHHKKIVHL